MRHSRPVILDKLLFWQIEIVFKPSGVGSYHRKAMGDLDKNNQDMITTAQHSPDGGLPFGCSLGKPNGREARRGSWSVLASPRLQRQFRFPCVKDTAPLPIRNLDWIAVSVYPCQTALQDRTRNDVAGHSWRHYVTGGSLRPKLFNGYIVDMPKRPIQPRID